MYEIICYTTYLPEGSEQNLSFLELLLDENWASAGISFPEELFSVIGNKNTKLTAKQDYEFLLRAAKHYSIKAVGASYLQTQSADSPSPWASFCSDCYILGKYQQELLDSGYFNPAAETLLHAAAALPNPKDGTKWLEQMISHAPEYYEIDDNTQPILIYRGSDFCSNVLNLFAEELAKVFLSLRQRVEVFDIEKEGNQALTKNISRHFKAVIGIQTYVFSIKMQDNTTNLHDLIEGPKFNFILDHPAWLREHIFNAPENYYILTLDRNYQTFAKKYYKKIKDCFFFPPAGCLPAAQNHLPKRYDLTFIGSYRNYRERLEVLRTYDSKHRHFAARYLGIMKKHPELPAESAFSQVLASYRLSLADEDFLDLFYEMRQVCFCIMLYYREKVISTLLHAQIEVQVYGESWKNAPFSNHPCLMIHPEVDAAASLQIMQESKLSLNIMSWHKDGLTERILNAMLCQSVVISDTSTALTEFFTDREDLLLFDLKRLDTLPPLIKTILTDEKQLEQIAVSGYQKALTHHLWTNRADLLLQQLDYNIRR